MRGPGMRLGLDVRRLWRCPQCGAQRKLPADVTSVRCSGCSAAPFMQIVEPPRRPRPAPKPLNPFLTIDLDTPEEGESQHPTATVVVSETVVESVTVEGTAGGGGSHPSSGPPHGRTERRNKPRRQRDRHGKSDRPPQSSATAPPPASPPAVMKTPEPAPAPSPPDDPPAANPGGEL